MLSKPHKLLHHATESLLPATLDPPGKRIRNPGVHFLVSRSKHPKPAGETHPPVVRHG
jgi:hypothetical protein